MEETVNHKLLTDWARKPKIYTECSVSLMTSAEKRQPPPNDLANCTLHVALYTPTLHFPLYMFHFAHSTLHIALNALNFTCCTFHNALYTFNFASCTLHMALYTLYIHCTLHITLYTLHYTHFTFYFTKRS